MNRLLISVLFISSTTIFSQELDEAYLSSLPDEIKGDVLQKINEREVADEPVYKRKSTMVDKPETESDRFGDQIFNMMQSSFMPINEPNFDSSYVLDFGDTLELQLIGQKNSIENLLIKRDGSINIPEIGKIFVSGLTLDTVNKLIKAKISTSFIGIEAFITLVNIRDIQVLITGNAFNPGIYTLNGNSNVLHALSMAGGIDANGSYRAIDLIREDKVIDSIDLYDIFIYGKSGFGERLRSGDVILVRPYLKLVNISGAVKRPGRFELKNDETFLDLLEYGNGLADNANLSTLRIERAQDESIVYIKLKDIESLANFEVLSSDKLNIRGFERRTVKISGAIKTPGTYTISKGETLSSIINKADGYESDAYAFGSALYNVNALKVNTDAVEKLYRSFVQKLITKGDALFASESLPFILEELKNVQVSGRVMAEFDLDVIKSNPDLDTTLEDGDEIVIPLKTEQVYIFGEINAGGAVRYQPSMSLDRYISKVGGMLDSADESNIFVIHPNGEIIRETNTQTFFNTRNSNHLIYPGSVIYVPRKVESRDAALVASIWAPIVSSAATSITALSVLNNK